MRIFSLTHHIWAALATCVLTGLLSCSALALEGRANVTEYTAQPGSVLDGPSQALESFGLAVNGQGPFAWERSEITADGAIIYYNFTPSRKRSGKSMSIDALELRGANMVNGEAVFSSVKLSGLAVIDDDADLKIRSMSLKQPSPAVFAALGAALRQEDGFEFSLAGMGFSDFSLSDASVTVFTHDGDVTGRLGALNLSGINDEKAGSVTLSDFDIRGPLDNGAPFDMSLGRFDIKGLNTGKYIKLIETLQAMDKSGANMDLAALDYDPYSLDYDRVAIKDFAGSVDGLSLLMPSLTADVSEQGNMAIVTQTLAPTTFYVQDGGGEAAQKISQALFENGYDSLRLSSRSVTFMDATSDWISTSSTLTLDQSFDLEMRADIGGVAAFTKSVIAAGGEPDPATLDALKIQSLDLTFTDKGATQKVLNFAAKEQGITPEELRETITATLTLLANSQLKGQSKAQGRDVIKTLGRFITDPNVIQFGILPLDGIVLSELAKAAESGDISNIGFYALAD